MPNSPKKSSEEKSSQKKTSAQKSEISEKVSSAPAKRTAPKKAAVPKQKSLQEKLDSTVDQVRISAKKTFEKLSDQAESNPKEGVKMLGILHLVGNILSGGLLGILLVVCYLLVRKDTLSQLEKETCYEIINFNLSFLIYGFISACLMIILVGFILLPVVAITGLVLMILGFLHHLTGDNYRYPLTIRFVS